MSATLRLLLVDDEATLRRLFVLALRRMPWAVDEADSAERALERLRQTSYDLLLVDKNLPNKSGVDLVREVRARDQSLPIIVMTGHSTADSAAELLNLGISAFLEKPFDDIGSVLRIIEGVLGRPGAAARSAVSAASAASLHFKKATSALDVRSREALDLLLVSPRGELAEWFSRTYGCGSDRVLIAGDLATGIGLLAADRPQLCIVDELLIDELAPWVMRAKSTSPDTAMAVICARPSLATITALIGAGVRALLPAPEPPGRPPWTERLDQLILGLRQARTFTSGVRAGA